MFGFISRLIRKIRSTPTKNDIDELKKLVALYFIERNKKMTFKSLQDAEFKVFSQWGEDGIIQYLINKIPIKNKVFIEIGVEDYKESNTRFLLENDNYSGLVIEASPKHCEAIKKSDLYWKYDLEVRNVFVTRDNINRIIQEYIQSNVYDSEIALLSIDIDGNDYYIWEAINCIQPTIVICEYNWIFGNKLPLVIPYEENFIRTKKHYSNLFYGASITSLYNLSKKKGYEYIGCTKAGNDAFFVKKEYAEKYVKELITTPLDTFNEQKAKESRDKEGNLTFIRGKDRINVIKDMEVIDLLNNRVVKIKDLIIEGYL